MCDSSTVVHSEDMALILLGIFLLMAQVFADCPEKSALANFNTSAFVGTWHTVKTDAPGSLLHARSNTKCLHNVFTQVGGNLNFLTLVYDKTSSEYKRWSGVLTKEDATSNDGKFTVPGASQTSGGGKQYIIDTDYTNYAVTWLCVTRDNSTLDLTAVLSRAKMLSAASEIEVNKVLPSGDYSLADQTDCPDHDHRSH